MMVEQDLQRIIQAIHAGPMTDWPDDLEAQDFPLDPVGRITEPSTGADPSLSAFAQPEADSLVDPMTATDEERKLAKETHAQHTPGSAASFQSAQAATMQSPASWFAEWGGGESGDMSGFIPTKAMVKIEGGNHYMKPDAAKAYKAMQRAAKKDGINFAITDSYRDYDTQVRLKQQKPTLAATPGHSNHGWGLALDINVGDGTMSNATYAWLKQNGAKFGFGQPMSYEPWHWEYKGGGVAAPVTRVKGKRVFKNERTKDPLNRIQGVSSFISAPTVFGAVLADIENPPQTAQAWKEREQSGGLGFAPARYRGMIRDVADKYNLPARLVAAIAKAESGFAPDVMKFQRNSSAGAVGPMQVMPLHTATYGDKFTKSIKANFTVGAAIFASYLNKAEGNLRLALAMYNAGPNASSELLEERMRIYADPILATFRGEA